MFAQRHHCRVHSGVRASSLVEKEEKIKATDAKALFSFSHMSAESRGHHGVRASSPKSVLFAESRVHIGARAVRERILLSILAES